MATKKSASAAKKSTKKSTPAAKKTTTKVTTVKAASAAASSSKASTKFSFSRSPLLAAGIAELVGTFMLAAIVLTTAGSSVLILFALTAIVLAVGAVSGAHVNPAITIGAWVTRRVDSMRAVTYLVAQVLGALLALVVVNGFLSAAPEPAANSQQMLFAAQAAAPELFKLGEVVKDKEWLLLAAEMLGTALFAFGVASTSREKNRMATAFTVGGSLFLALTVVSYLTGVATGAAGNAGPAVLNPAIAASLQGLAWSWWPIAIYALAPAVGGVIGFAVRDLLQNESEAKA
ncbi:MAG TPA: aquaporin [Candidatus Saccharimonadales bacterium]